MNQLIPHPRIEGGGFLLNLLITIKNYADGRMIVS